MNISEIDNYFDLQEKMRKEEIDLLVTKIKGIGGGKRGKSSSKMV